jgi:AAA15 family ATPase/GTPase
VEFTLKATILRDLTIQNYRSFKNFHIEHLARVNLIVGMNNSGKTSLLEAAYLLVNQNSPLSLYEVLYNRGEIVERLTYTDENSRSPTVITGYQVDNIFYKYESEIEKNISIRSAKNRSLELEIH